ncbi:hypothetical protein DICVIV_08515 [Dictyocaulus viviparus]|uniref:sphinganine-1-phosphate aldolase n=1 Tax=Dictyocaulus viviparus TaxID=29172 RepID=A0A0D8XST1_DICVI|nr:hypothetical protein DICVIV_08515 [Dictyocaulus viviparus]
MADDLGTAVDVLSIVNRSYEKTKIMGLRTICKQLAMHSHHSQSKKALIILQLVASAPNFPSGTVDPVPEVSELGKKYNIPVHVDACLGGFIIPFMSECGFNIPVFDFRNSGVTSISCDTHKYGCTPKGSSIIMYRSKELLHYQYFSIPEWTGGIYATPTICGSRAGANSAVAWATLLFFGKKEYFRRCAAIVSCTKKIAAGINKIPGLEESIHAI